MKLFTWVKKDGNVAATWWPSISAAVSPCRAPITFGHHGFSPSTSTGEVFEARCPMTHKFQVGQTVLPAHPKGANPGTYVIVQVLPETSHER